MATTARQSKQQRKPDAASRRTQAWTGARASPTFSPAPSNNRLPNGPAPAGPGGFNHTQNAPSRPQDRILQQLSGLTGTTITLSTKTSQRYEGVVASTGGEGDTTGVTLKDVKELTSPGAPLRESLFIASTNIDTWASGPADAKAPNGSDSFKTDTDISQKAATRRERELQAWQPTPEGQEPAQSASAQILSAIGASARQHADDMTFGPGSSQANQGWDQFDVNEKLFGVRASFDEEAYTTKLDRNAPDYKEREKKAQQLANEILGSVVNNSHVAEERVMNFAGENGANEEEKYGAVVRSPGAYVPPGARPKNAPVPTSAVPTLSVTTNGAKSEVPAISVTVNAPDGSTVAANPPTAAGTKPAADAVPAFRDFVHLERDRLLKKKQALLKSEMDKRMADLVTFSRNFKLNKPIPDDLVPILAKDEEKQRQIKEKSAKDAESTGARVIGPLNTTATASNSSTTPSLTRITTPAAPGSAKPPAAIPQIAKASAASKSSITSTTTSSKPVASKNANGISATDSSTSTSPASTKAGRISMVIQAIPPFRGKRASVAPVSTNTSGSTASTSGANATSTKANVANSPLSPTSQNRLNVNATSFRPGSKPFSPTGTPSVNGAASPKVKADSPPQPQSPNPFFGARVPKKSPPVHIKEDFNPFKYAKVGEASAVGPNWSYTGKRYMSIFPPPPAVPQQPQSPHIPPPPPPAAIPPAPYGEEDPQQQAARGYVYAYQPYGYPQPMMPGMPPPPPGYIPGPFMQPMPYPHMPPPNAMYANAPMGQMPPPQAYMHPPPGTYPPPPNGGGPRPSMPPTPIPSHAHPYYQQSPQIPHAVPYPMMMPPPGAPGGPPHPYENAQASQVPMGGVGHA